MGKDDFISCLCECKVTLLSGRTTVIELTVRAGKTANSCNAKFIATNTGPTSIAGTASPYLLQSKSDTTTINLGLSEVQELPFCLR